MAGEFTVDAFIRKWRAVELKESSASQEHFLDLCRLLDEPSPAEADPTGESYCFERGATKTSGGDGWADVWKRGHFGWEYKGKRKNLDAAFGQMSNFSGSVRWGRTGLYSLRSRLRRLPPSGDDPRVRF